MTSPEVIFTICRRTTASPYYILKSLLPEQETELEQEAKHNQPVDRPAVTSKDYVLA